MPPRLRVTRRHLPALTASSAAIATTFPKNRWLRIAGGVTAVGLALTSLIFPSAAPTYQGYEQGTRSEQPAYVQRETSRYKVRKPIRASDTGDHPGEGGRIPESLLDELLSAYMAHAKSRTRTHPTEKESAHEDGDISAEFQELRARKEKGEISTKEYFLEAQRLVRSSEDFHHWLEHLVLHIAEAGSEEAVRDWRREERRTK